MRALSNLALALVPSALVLIAAGCGDSGNGGNSRDAAVDQQVLVGPPDGRGPTVDGTGSSPDLPGDADRESGSPDAPLTHDLADDGSGAGMDGPGSPTDSAGAPLDGTTAEAGGSELGATGRDGGGVGTDGGAPLDAPADAAPDGFAPGPATPVVVNSGNTAAYSLGDGTWKVFYFEATAGQLYCISDLSGLVRGYVSASASVSPGNYQYATDATDGTLAFTAAAAQRYYIAVAVSGGGASGSFQVADGGQLLALGSNAVSLDAPAADNYHFFRFPISAGHDYSISVTGPASPSVGLGVSPHAERASNGQFSMGAWGLSSNLPISNETISAASVAQSYSGYYFFFLRVPSAIAVIVTLTRAS
jgi:hypothetical protein